MSDYSLPSIAPDPKRDDPPTFLTDALDLLRQLNLAHADDPTGPDALPSVPGYEILGELGRGGMGVVYKARQTGLNRVVALKMILGAKTAGTNDLLRFLAEAEAVAAVRHPNVVEVYELGQCGGRPYFAMEFVPGGSLAELLRGKGDVPPRRPSPAGAAALLAAVARGVHAAHQAGIVHRDLKPANVLLSFVSGRSSFVEHPSGVTPLIRDPRMTNDHEPMTPKVSDFGLAKRLSSDLTQSLAVMGTPHYMAPEQAGGKAKFVGPAADVYALGVILYECLTGGVPFAAVEPWSVIRKVIDEMPAPPSTRADGVPRDIELICLKCLEKEPHHRYPTAAALADDLEAFAAGLPVSVRPVGAAARTWRWARRNPPQAALAAVLLLLALVVPPLVVWNRGQLAESAAAAEGAKKAQAEAEKLATARELFGLMSAVRHRAVDRPTGWTRANRADLARAADLATADALTDLRSEGVSVALAADLRPLDAVSKGMTASVAVTSPDGAHVAVGEFKARGLDKIAGFDLGLTAKVRLLDPNTGAVRREFGYPVGFGGGAQDGTRALAFSPDGRVLFVGTRGGVVYRFDLAAGDDPKPKKWAAFKTEVSQLAVSPDGASVYGRTLTDPPIRRWDAATGNLLSTFDAEGGARALAVEPGTGDVVASNGSHLFRLSADLKPRGERVPVTDGHPRILAFACGGRLLLAACFETLVLYDPATLTATARFLDPDLRRSSHQDHISATVVHPTGAYVATSCSHDEDRQVKVWEVASGRRVAAVGVPGTVPLGLAWSADGSALYATAAGSVQRFAFTPPPAERFACLHPSPIEAAAVSPDAVAAVGMDESHGDRRTLVVTDAAGRTTAVSLPGESLISRTGVALDPHPERRGRVVVTTKDKRAVEWRPGGPVVGLSPGEGAPSNPRFSPDGSCLWLTTGPTLTAWDATGRQKRGAWTNDLAGILSGLHGLDSVAVGPTRAVAGGRNGSVFVLIPEGEKLTKRAEFPRPGDPVSSVSLSPDESLAAAGTRSGVVRLCRIADGTETALEGHAGGVTGVSFRRDGTLLATGGKDRSVKLWRRAGDTFELLFAASDLPSAVASVEFSPADDTLLVLLVNEHAVRVWDVARLRTHLSGLKLGW